MCKRISARLYQVSSGRVALAGLLIFVLFAMTVLPGQSAAVDRYARSAGSPDTSFLYSPADLYDMAKAYGAEGRQAYVRARFTFDLVFPLVFTLFLTTSISWLYDRVFAPGSRWRRANLLPLLGALFDYAENVSAAVVMVRYPQRTPLLDVLASVSTPLKWLFVGGSFVLLLIGVVAVVRQGLGQRSSP
jgi:hypothetical protein